MRPAHQRREMDRTLDPADALETSRAWARLLTMHSICGVGRRRRRALRRPAGRQDPDGDADQRLVEHAGPGCEFTLRRDVRAGVSVPTLLMLDDAASIRRSAGWVAVQRTTLDP